MESSHHTEYLSILGLVKGESEYTYPPYSDVQARELIDGLRNIAPYVVIDCGSYIANDILSAVALMESDAVLRLANADLKSISYLSSQLPLLKDAGWDLDKQYKTASNVKPQQAGDHMAKALGTVAFTLPYDSAEGLLTAMFLLVAEYLPTEDENGNPVEKRHIVSVFKLVQELLAPSKVKGKNQFQILLEKLPPNHKARWFAGSALNTAEQAMASVISTVLSRLNAFLDSEMEQILCFDTAIDAEKFCNEKSAIFIVLPEEDQTKYFMVSLILQNLYREILTVADENGGRLKNRVVFFADELGTCPPIQSLELMFSASRSRGLMLVPIVQSITGQLKKNYGAEGAEVIVDNCQVNLYGGFAPASQTAVELSKALGSRTVMSGSISRGKNDPSQSLQMIERPLMTPDELKSMPKGSFIVAKTGVHPMKVKLRLFLDWGIRFGEPYEVPEKAQRAVAYADKQELEESIIRRHYGTVAEEEPPQDVPAAVGGMNHGMQAEKNSRKTILRP